VPKGQSLMRTSYMATHTDEHLDRILEAFRKVGIQQGIIDRNGHSLQE
jgi:8-amino-7-oxononanoate synthase